MAPTMDKGGRINRGQNITLGYLSYANDILTAKDGRIWRSCGRVCEGEENQIWVKERGE